MTPGEKVLVVERSVLMGDPGWEGIRTEGLASFDEIVAVHGHFVDRESAELDRRLKQVIPYLVLRDGPAYFLMRRTKAGGDSRLFDRYSIGVGGHLNPGDGDLAGGLRREWAEELDAAFVPEFQLVGVLNDDSTEVGSVHVGAVYVADATGRAVRIRETDKLEGRFAGPAEVASHVEAMESWSAIVFRHLEGRAATP